MVRYIISRHAQSKIWLTILKKWQRLKEISQNLLAAICWLAKIQPRHR